MSRCEYCPAGWEDRSYEGECNGYGCRILGFEILDENCKLSKDQIRIRLKELEDYEAGKIERPQWVVNKFIREMDNNMLDNRLGLFLPGYPPKRMRNGCYQSLHSGMSLQDTAEHNYKHGYQDAKDGKEPEYK